MKILNTEQTKNALPFDQLIPAIAKMFKTGCTVPQRHIHSIGTETAPVTTLIMPAWSNTGYMGIKTVNIAPNNREKSLPGLFSTYTLYNSVTGEPIAQLDGNEITSRRTAAASALAASYLADPSSTQLTVVGSGRVASLIPYAYRAVLPIKKVKVWNISPESAIRLVEQLNKAGFEAELAKDLEDAVQWADIVSCATLAQEPLIKGAWLKAGSHLDLIGSFAPWMRESDDDAITQGSLFIDTPEALIKSGDLLDPIANKTLSPKDVIGTLEQLCRGECRVRQSSDERTTFKAVGSALEDLASALLAYKQNK